MTILALIRAECLGAVLDLNAAFARNRPRGGWLSMTLLRLYGAYAWAKSPVSSEGA
jgi:hypothetical protein